MKKTEPHSILGVLLHPDTSAPSASWVKYGATFLSQAGIKMVESKKLFDINVIVQEHEEKEKFEEPHVQGVMTIRKCPISVVDLMITEIEEPPKKKKRRKNLPEDNNQIVLFIGDLDFCLAGLHMGSTAEGDWAANWGLHAMRYVVGELKNGGIVYTDTRERYKYIVADIDNWLDCLRQSALANVVR